MVDVLNIYPKDWHIRIELSLEQLNMLLDFLDMCEFHGEPNNEKHMKAKEYVINEFFATLNKVTEDMERGK